LAEQILNEKKLDLSRLVIVPSHSGRFEITVDGNLAFSKLKEGRFPEDEEIEALLW